MSTLQIIDNFLPDEVFERFAVACITLPHYHCLDYATDINDSDGSILTLGEDLADIDRVTPEIMFQAVLLERHTNLLRVTDFYLESHEFIETIKEKLNVKKFHMLRANCTVRQPQAYQGEFHTDMRRRDSNLKIAILYLNTNNGGTLFKDGTKNGTFVKSKINRCVIAPIDMKHAGVWHTDAKLRFVLNINYEEN